MDGSVFLPFFLVSFHTEARRVKEIHVKLITFEDLQVNKMKRDKEQSKRFEEVCKRVVIMDHGFSLKERKKIM